MYKIAAVGEKDVIMGFKGLGIDIYPVINSQEGFNTLEKISSMNEVSLILVTESIIEGVLNELKGLRERVEKAILIIPTHKKSSNISLLEMKASVERAIGIDLISKEEV